MRFGKDGAEIRTCKSVGNNSNLGENFIVMWDNDDVPIHIHKKIVEYLYKKIQESDKTANEEVDIINDSPFII